MLILYLDHIISQLDQIILYHIFRILVLVIYRLFIRRVGLRCFGGLLGLGLKFVSCSGLVNRIFRELRGLLMILRNSYNPQFTYISYNTLLLCSFINSLNLFLLLLNIIHNNLYFLNQIPNRCRTFLQYILNITYFLIIILYL